MLIVLGTMVVGGVRDGAGCGIGSDAEAAPLTTVASASVPEGNATDSAKPPPSSAESQKGLFSAPQLHHCNNSIVERSHEGDHPSRG